MTKFSLKCRLYGDRAHTPCSGTTDDGTESPCECPCHTSPVVTVDLMYPYPWELARRAWLGHMLHCDQCFAVALSYNNHRCADGQRIRNVFLGKEDLA